jgi:Zn-dependent protease with chaperone function
LTALLAASIIAALGLPHSLDQTRLSPGAGVVLWAGVLALRAALAAGAVAIVVLLVPATELFQLLTHWCVHAVVPFLATHLGFDGHRLGDAAVLVPALVIAISVVSSGFAAWRGARMVRAWLRSNSLGAGPRASLIVCDREIVLAAAGLRAPKVVVSAGALLSLDDDELAAGLEHEWGHIAHRHRFVALAGQLLRAISRFLPGSTRALELLRFHLERDADEFAVGRTGNPKALASAICKTAGAPATANAAFAGLGGSGTPDRVRILLAPLMVPSRVGNAIARLLASGTAVLVLVLILAAPTLARAGLAPEPAPAAPTTQAPASSCVSS